MRKIAFFCLAATMVALPAAAADLPVYGKWTNDGNCGRPFVTITSKTYKVDGGAGGSIKSIEQSGKDFRIELRDGYAFSMIGVGKTKATWTSLATGDTFDVIRCK